MKKFLAIIFTVAIVASMAALPVSAEEWTQVIQETVENDFEIYETNTNAYTDDDRVGAPENCITGVYGGRFVDPSADVKEFYQDDELDVGVRVVDVNGDKMIQLSRHKEHHVNTSFQIAAPTAVLGDNGDVAASFTFTYKKLGDYGVAVRLGTDLTNLTDSWNWTNCIANINKTANGEDWLSVWSNTAAQDPACGGRRMTNALKLEANKEYNVVFLFHSEDGMLTNTYQLIVNGEVIGQYAHYDYLMAVTGLRIDEHGYDMNSTAEENLKDEIYFDDFVIGTAVNPEDYVEATPVPSDPAVTDAPVDPTDAPVDPTDVPVDSTDVPVDPTDAPVDPTDAPAEPTDAPVEPTDAPVVEPTDAPVEPTDAPAEPTDAPAEPTAAPTTAPEEEGGCGSVITGSATVMMAMAAAVVLLKKKNH